MKILKAYEKVTESYKGPKSWTIVAILLVATFIYDFGYYFHLGTGFYNLPTTLVDHYRTALECLSPIFVFIFFFIATSFLPDKSKKYKSSQFPSRFLNIIKSIIKKTIGNIFNNKNFATYFFVLILSFLCVTFVLEYFFYLEEYPGASIVMSTYYIVFWVMFLNKTLDSDLARKEYSMEKRVLYKVSSIFIIFFFMYGYKSAAYDIYAAHRGDKKVIFRNSPNLQNNKSLLRTIEKGVIVYDTKTQQTEYYPWEEVKGLTYPKPNFTILGFISTLTGDSALYNQYSSQKK